MPLDNPDKGNFYRKLSGDFPPHPLRKRLACLRLWAESRLLRLFSAIETVRGALRCKRACRRALFGRKGSSFPTQKTVITVTDTYTQLRDKQTGGGQMGMVRRLGSRANKAD